MFAKWLNVPSSTFVLGVCIEQCFSTRVLQNLRIPQVAARGSAETDQNYLERNLQPRLHALAAI